MDLKAYERKKEKLIRNFDGLIKLAQDLDMKSLVADLKLDIELLKQEKFQIVVVGEFSRGKSTFINAMLGRRILPSSKNPTTAVISKIVYKASPQYVLYYKEERIQPKKITEEKFLELVAPKEVDLLDKVKSLISHQKQTELDRIKYAEIGFPLKLCQDNVDVVDTPGTNDLNVGRIEITYRYINQADAIILVLSANQALTKSELTFLQEKIISNHIRDIFIVINYKDTISSLDQKRVYEYVKRSLQDNISNEFNQMKIHMVSSLQTLYYRRKANGEILKPKQVAKTPVDLSDTGFLEFESALERYLSLEKGNSKLSKYIQRGFDVASSMHNDVDIRRKLVAQSVDEIEQQFQKQYKEVQQIKHKIEKIIASMRNNLDGAEAELCLRCDRGIHNIKDAAYTAIDNFISDFDQQEVIKDVKWTITKEQKSLIDEISQFQAKIFEYELGEVNQKIKQIWNDMNFNYDIDYQMNFRINPDMFTQNLSFGNDELIRAGGTIAGAAIGAAVAGPVGFFIGGWLGGALFGDDSSDSEKEATMRRRLKNSISANFTTKNNHLTENILMQYKKSVQLLCDHISKAVEGRLEDMNRQVNAALSDKKRQEAEVINKKLASYQNRIKEISNELKNI